jgi:hypothetical protein
MRNEWEEKERDCLSRKMKAGNALFDSHFPQPRFKRTVVTREVPLFRLSTSTLWKNFSLSLLTQSIVVTAAVAVNLTIDWFSAITCLIVFFGIGPCFSFAAIAIRNAGTDSTLLGTTSRIMVSNAEEPMEREKGKKYLSELARKDGLAFEKNSLLSDIILYISPVVLAFFPALGVALRPDRFGTTSDQLIVLAPSVFLTLLIGWFALEHLTFYRSEYSGLIKLGMHNYLRPPGFYWSYFWGRFTGVMLLIFLPAVAIVAMLNLVSNYGFVAFMVMLLGGAWFILVWVMLFIILPCGYAATAEQVRNYSSGSVNPFFVEFASEEVLAVSKIVQKMLVNHAALEPILTPLYQCCLRLRSERLAFNRKMPLEPSAFITTVNPLENGLPSQVLLYVIHQIGCKNPGEIARAYLEARYVAYLRAVLLGEVKNIHHESPEYKAYKAMSDKQKRKEEEKREAQHQRDLKELAKIANSYPNDPRWDAWRGYKEPYKPPHWDQRSSKQ